MQSPVATRVTAGVRGIEIETARTSQDKDAVLKQVVTIPIGHHLEAAGSMEVAEVSVEAQ
jgi:hypothetical protein